MRSRDIYPQQQYKPNKDTKDEGKGKTEMVPPRPPVTSGISGPNASVFDHAADLNTTPVVSSTTASSSPGTAMSARQPLMHPPPSKSLDSKDQSNNASLDHVEKSPSVSIKIVKSPAPVASPLSMISPHSVASQPSPCIIDDDLMDEALMGTRK